MIICNFNLFDKDQKVFAVNPETEEMTLVTTSDFDNLGVNIGKSCQKMDIYQVHLYGNNEYLKEIVIPQLTEYISKDYKKDELEIEVN